MSQNISANTAMARNLWPCHACGQMHAASILPQGHMARCVRCDALLHSRIDQSLSKTWALVIAGLILYIPANLYPVMTITMMGRPQPSTILAGVQDLFTSGSWVVGLLVFCASIVVPLAKLLGLIYLLISVQARSTWRSRDRTRLHRVISMIGRWSMLDLFLLSILVALVKLGALATVEPGLGAVAFAAVVILTMLAAHSFDPRLIWDTPQSTQASTS